TIPDEKQTKIFYDWVAKNGIPDWKMQQIKRDASHDRTYGLDPDLACLRSVSANFKARTQLNRNLDRRIKQSLASVANRFSSQSFFEKTVEKFGFRVDWYD